MRAGPRVAAVAQWHLERHVFWRHQLCQDHHSGLRTASLLLFSCHTLTRTQAGSMGDTQRNFVAGLLAGTAACMMNNPFDVVKSRVQNTLPGQAARYNWAWPAMLTIAREEGYVLRLTCARMLLLFSVMFYTCACLHVRLRVFNIMIFYQAKGAVQGVRAEGDAPGARRRHHDCRF